MLVLNLLVLASLAASLVTLEAIIEISNLTKECTHKILRVEPLRTADMKAAEMGMGQTIFMNDDEDGGDIEDTVATILNTMNRKVLEVLNVPLDRPVAMQQSPVSCPVIVHGFDNFMALTTRFLYAIQEKQQIYQWHGQSPVYYALSWLHDLWASRKPNEQGKSFIEQQMSCYSHTGCFKNIREVLKKDVEIVEYMNDLLDYF